MTKTDKVLISVAVILAAINVYDFFYDGQQIRNLAGATGFALLAFGTYKNVSWATATGAVLAIGAIVVKHLA